MFYIFDLETYPNFFSFAGKFEDSSEIHTYEISDRINQRDELLARLSYLRNCGATMVGYNNLGFDYPILHELLTNPYTFDEKKALELCDKIINSQQYGSVAFNVRPNDRYIPQLDLIKINHFDNKMKRVSLKSLQVAMRSESVEDLPFPPGVNVNDEQKDLMLKYNIHDITETEKFLKHCKPLIEMRQDLLDRGVLRGDVLNYNDVKIGKEYLIKQIGRANCYVKGSKPKQTIRHTIPVGNIILPHTRFRSESFQEVLEWFKSQTINLAGGKKPKLEKELAGLQFHFGLGGVHASRDHKVYESNETHVIKDVDVAGMYPAVAIANMFYPEHLGEAFVSAYKKVYQDRRGYPKGTSMNKMLKLAANGVYGDSNNPYSPFFDPQYTFKVTINGQLQLLMLVEVLSLIPGLEIIQANTDGVTVYMPRSMENLFKLWCDDWQEKTGLVLEEVEYSRMWIADVNNYIAEDTKGKLKNKGRYWYPKSWSDYEGVWNKNFSKLVVQMGAEQAMVNGIRPEDFVYLAHDPFDFMLSYKATGKSKLYVGDKAMTKTVRYYVSKQGEKMKKIAPPKGKLGDYKRKNGISDQYFNRVMSEIHAWDQPQGSGPIWDERIHTKNKSRYEEVTTSIESGWLVKECNRADKFDWNDVDFDYYINEIKKLVIK